jgi:predicted nucleotidyltransferase
VPTLDQASLTAPERTALERLVSLLEQHFGEDLHGVWLFGSRARGEPPHPESDIDLLVVAKDRSYEAGMQVQRLIDEATEGTGVSPTWFAAHLYDLELVANRREIRSFFIQEVDRDKIVLTGKP